MPGRFGVLQMARHLGEVAVAPSIRSLSWTVRTVCSGVRLRCFIVVILPSFGTQTHNTRTQVSDHVSPGVGGNCLCSRFCNERLSGDETPHRHSPSGVIHRSGWRVFADGVGTLEAPPALLVALGYWSRP